MTWANFGPRLTPLVIANLGLRFSTLLIYLTGYGSHQ